MSHDPAYPAPPDPLDGREAEFGAAALSPADELPPVTPPSASFIVQLFLVPALIVTVVVGIYLIFGRLAAGEQDWRRQLTDLRHANPHVRWRGALGLAQMLQADVTADGHRLAENRDVATELAALLSESLQQASTREDDIKQQEFLTRTLGLLDVSDVTFPVLVEGMDQARDREVRKNALASTATIAYRAREQGRPLDEGPVISPVIEATNDADAMIRHLATYALGLLSSPQAQERLLVLLDDGDELTRANAAFALARQGSAAGVPVLVEILKSSGRSPAPPSSQSDEMSTDEVMALVEAPKLSNTLHALDDLSGQLEPAVRGQVVNLLAPIAESHADGNTRVAARLLRDKLAD